MIYFSGRFSNLIMALSYAVMGGFLVLRRDNAHRVKIYHSRAYINCDVDGDDNPYTCISDYTVVRTFSFNAGYVFGSALVLSSLFATMQMGLQKKHVYSTIYYIDTIISNSQMTFAVAVVSGIQGMFPLVLMMMNTIMYESGMYLHDIGFWSSPANKPYNNKGKLFVLILLNFFTLLVNVFAVIDYWSVSKIPIFIPMVMLLWFLHFIMLRFVCFRYFYGTMSAILKRGLKSERDSFFDKGGEGGGITKYQLVVKEEPFSIDHFDSWKNGINFFFKMIIAVTFYIGTNNVKIYYK
jgi:hypothetical protein